MESDSSQFAIEFERFIRLFKALPSHLMPTEVSERIYLLGPHDGDHIDLCLSAIIHGNELGGLQALNIFLEQLMFGQLPDNFRLLIILGNLEAAAKNKRFLEKDLNRSFGSIGGDSHEEQLARNFEPFLAVCKQALDLHQTNNPTLSDFFIFPDSDHNVGMAHTLDPKVPVVVHETEFSKDGMCLDTYVTTNGGQGICYEMGPAGSINQNHFKKAAHICNIATQKQLVQKRPQSIYYLHESIDSSKDAYLEPGLENFTMIQKGETLGYNGDQPISLDYTGHIIFPKYGEAAMQSSELCQIMKNLPYKKQYMKSTPKTELNI